MRKKQMYDALHIGILKKFDDDEKYLNKNVDGIRKINEEYVNYDKKPETILTYRDANIVIVIIMILPKGLRSREFDGIKVLLREKLITFKENYTNTHLKTGMNFSIQEYFRGIFVMKSKVNE